MVVRFVTDAQSRVWQTGQAPPDPADRFPSTKSLHVDFICYLSVFTSRASLGSKVYWKWPSIIKGTKGFVLCHFLW